MRLTIRILFGIIFTLLMAGQAIAQEVQIQSSGFFDTADFHVAVPNAGSDLRGDTIVVPNGSSPEAGAFRTVSAPQVIPNRRVIDKKFIVALSSLAAAESLRFTTRKLVVDREFAAGAPWITAVPSNPHIIARDAAFFASEVLVAYAIKKRHGWLPGDRVIQKLWWVYPAAMTTLHIKNAVGNIRTQGPGGCTSIECAEQMQTQ